MRRSRTSGFVGPLHGIPVIMKDQADVKGMPTTLGSVLFKDYMPDHDCFVAAKLKKAGVIFLGKATLGELGGGDTHGSLFGSTRNVYDLERTAGGSSGGSGASVSANFCAVAVGQEGFASIRRPSIWNGVAGMRPTMGLVSRGGVYGGWPTINGSLGPMARTVTDLAKLLDSMVGYDPDDPVTAYGIGHTAEAIRHALDKGALKGARHRHPARVDGLCTPNPIPTISRRSPRCSTRRWPICARPAPRSSIRSSFPTSRRCMAHADAQHRRRRRYVRAVLQGRQCAVCDTRGRDGLAAVPAGHQQRPRAAGSNAEFDRASSSPTMRARETLMINMLKVMAITGSTRSFTKRSSISRR